MYFPALCTCIQGHMVKLEGNQSTSGVFPSENQECFKISEQLYNKMGGRVHKSTDYSDWRL